jgi:ankyrin repeat protein
VHKQAGADINITNLRMRTPLYYAHHTNIIEQLVALGANVNARDIQGDTPLHSAIKGQNLYVAEALVRVGADLRMANDSGESPIDLCSPLQRRAMRELLDRMAKRRITIEGFSNGRLARDTVDQILARSYGRKPI